MCKGGGWGLALLILSHFSYISNENEISWYSLSETKFFHFHGLLLFQTGGWGEGVERPPVPPLPLATGLRI